MATCSELFQKDILRVYPIAAGQLTFTLPETVRKDTILPTELGKASITALKTWLTSLKRFTELEEPNAIELVQPATITVKSELDINGYEYVVTIELKTKFYDNTERMIVHQLEQNNNDYIIECIDESLFLVRFFSPGQNNAISQIKDETNQGIQISVSNRNLTGLQNIQS